MINIQLDLYTLGLWIVVGLIAGFLASRAMFGHGMGLVGDVVVGIIGAIIGGFLAAHFGINVSVVGHPIISEIIVAFFGALLMLLILRLFGAGRRVS
jgi:uncharacterized membrane protein YeaQ/YmgE (transglycosylase-associated protein family)